MCRYDYLSVVMPYEAMLQKIQPRQHCAWFKALLILNLLKCCSPSPSHYRDIGTQEYLSLPSPQTPQTPRSGSGSRSGNGINHPSSTSSSTFTWEQEEQKQGDEDKEEKQKEKQEEMMPAHDDQMFYKYQYLLWIDADAVVIDPQQSLQSFLRHAPSFCDLLISEDMGGEEGGSSCCPVNTGEFYYDVY